MRWAGGVISAYKVHTSGIWKSPNIGTGKKLFSMLGCCGYVFPIILCLLFITGTLAFVTHEPAPFDFAKFSSETIRNMLFTSGLLVTNFIALYRAKELRLGGKMFLSSFSFGLITVFYVNMGIVKAALGKHIDWYLLKKSTKV
jgi:hypothetical protein